LHDTDHVTTEGNSVSTCELNTEARAALIDLVLRGMLRTQLTPPLQSVVDAGLAIAKGPIVMPTPAAAPLVGEWLRIGSDSDDEAALTSAFRAFLPINRTLREVCTSWQCLPGGGTNDHTDAAYDAGVRDRLDDVHEAIAPVLRRASRVSDLYGEFAPRLQDALDQIDEGDARWLASPLVDSYHTVWMQVHQAFLLHLGVSRADDEALEQELVSGARP
jgi:hypothetical protein